jgi:hypothetical protein
MLDDDPTGANGGLVYQQPPPFMFEKQRPKKASKWKMPKA